MAHSADKPDAGAVCPFSFLRETRQTFTPIPVQNQTAHEYESGSNPQGVSTAHEYESVRAGVAAAHEYESTLSMNPHE